MHKSIFVSSTFQDFQRERDLLQTKVELRINELLRHVQVSFLDLRWGIDTTGQTNLEKVVSICIAEVLNSRPFYVIMLGDSYGSCVDSTVARSIYALNGLAYDGQEKSVTQIEIEATGLFQGNREYVLVLDRQTDRVPDPKAAALKQKVVAAALPENVYTYRAHVRDNSVFPEDEDALTEFITKRLYTFLKGESTLTEPQGAALAREYSQQFYGRQPLLDALREAVLSHKDGPVFRIYAPAGAGLTALIAKLYTDLQAQGAQAVFVAADSELPVPFSMAMIDAAEQLGIQAHSDGNFFEQLQKDAQYFFFLDGLSKIEADPIFHSLLRKKLIPSNVLFILAVEDPQAAHFSAEPPTKEDALALFEGTLRDYRKELPQSFRTYFESHIPQQMVCQPALLKQFISALCYLTEEDYRKLGSGSSFMEDLSDLFITKLVHFPQSEREHIRQAVLNASEAQLWLLGMLSIAPGGMDTKILLGALRSAGIDCDLLQLRTVKERFRDSILCTDGNLYQIRRKSFRNVVHSCFTPEQLRWLRYLSVSYIGQNLALFTRREIFPTVAYQYLMLEDYPLLARFLEMNCLMNDHASSNGLRFSLMCGDYGADTPSRHYRALVRENNAFCNCWLVKYAMPYLTELYRQNGADMFGQMYQTVVDSGTDSANAADLLALQAHGLALQLRGRQAQEITMQQLNSGKLKLLTNGSMIQYYLTACLSYDTDSAASTLDFILKGLTVSQPGTGELLWQLLRLTDLMDANALSYKPQLERLFALCEKFLTTQTYQDATSIAVFLLHLSSKLQIPLSQAQAIEAIVRGCSRIDLSISTHLTAVYREYFSAQEDAPLLWRELVDLVRVTLEDQVPLSTVDLFFVSAYFRRICYHSPESIPGNTAAGFARELFRRFWKIRGGICSMMQLVEMIYLGCMVCLYEGAEAALELMAPLLADPRVDNNALVMELDYFRQDANLLLDATKGSVQALNRLEKTFKRRK